MLHRLIRYAPILQVINAGDYRSLCELGSGSQGLCEFYPGQITGCDLNFDDYGKDKQVNSRLTPVKCSATATPFMDNQFDLVFSVDMLEHVPVGDRLAVLREMLRIAKKRVVIAFPGGREALQADQRLADFYRTCLGSVPGWLAEHLELGFIDQSDLVNLLNELPCSYSITGNENIHWHYRLLALESFLPFKILSKVLSHLCSPRLLHWLGANRAPTYRIVVTIEKND